MAGGVPGADPAGMRRVGIAAALLAGVLALTRPLPAADTTVDLVSLYRLRDEVLARKPAGRRHTELYYAHTAEVTALVAKDPALLEALFQNLLLWQPHLRELLDGRGDAAIVTSQQVSGALDVLGRLEAAGSPALRAVLQRERAALDLPSLVGRSMAQALARQAATAPPTVTIPAAASIHGVGGAFFHSDLRVLNPSATAPVSVVARYRCFVGPCPAAAERTFTVAPREMMVYDDVVATLFGGPETAGAIELTGAVLAESRVYTPKKPSPTTGSDVPGLPADQAFAEAVLLSLGRSAGFRTNVGIYNPGGEALSVSVDLHRPDGVRLGSAARTVPARGVVQVNDVFGAAGIVGDVPNAYAVVRADGVRELYAYATVIDNQSLDSVFVKGRNARGGEPDVVTVPAAASIHGVAPAFFHSDVRAFNPSATTATTLQATYRCFVGSCPANRVRTLTVKPREMLVLDDAVATLFAAPETAGAIELAGDVLVDSRVSTPTRPAPTTGTAIPGQAWGEATREAALLALSHSADPARGFRTNLGVFNPSLVELSVSVSLRRPDGAEVAKLTRTVPASSAVQVNDVFRVAGLAQDLPDAWALVTAGGRDVFFAYATVIDNRSQDPVYVRGRAMEAP